MKLEDMMEEDKYGGKDKVDSLVRLPMSSRLVEHGQCT